MSNLVKNGMDKLINTPNPQLDKLLNIVAAIFGEFPFLGTAINNVITGHVYERKFERIQKFIVMFKDEVEENQEKIKEEYIRKDEFEDLIEEVLLRVAADRNEERRILFKNLLFGFAVKPASYDESLSFIRILEQLQPNHLRILIAFTKDVDIYSRRMGSSSQIQTLEERLQKEDLNRNEILNLCDDLESFRLTKHVNTTSMTPGGASELKHLLTERGKRFLEYVKF